MTARRRTRAAVLMAVTFAVVLGACSSGAKMGDASVYVAVGASESLGVGAERPATQAWPVVLRRRALPS
ncbi:MAG: hypothetical protein ABIS21_04125, partial [Acidimicrobiales bacterium]